MKPKFLLWIAFVLAAGYGHAQSIVNGSVVSAVQEFSNSDYTVRWVIGDVIDETFETNSLVITSGLNENNTFTITGISPEEEASSIRWFPNPFANTLTIESTDINLQDASLSFSNAVGEVVNVTQTDIEKNRISFLTEDLNAGLYILTIKTSSNLLTHIKVIRE